MMHFDNINNSSQEYLIAITSIIRRGIQKSIHNLRLSKEKREGRKTQILVEQFNILGTIPTLNDKWIWIGAQKENEQEDNIFREDIYFYLNDDALTKVFFVEAKRLPKPPTKDKEEYVVGDNSNISGGIQRYKLERHGQRNLQHNGMIAYVENGSIDEWLHKINSKIMAEYPSDSTLISEELDNEYVSHHKYIDLDDTFSMYHFWIDLVTSQN